jgi:peroxiredoxin
MGSTFTVLVLSLAALSISACSASDGAALKVGDPAPTFTLPAASGEQVSLSDYQGSKPVLLYFHMADG